MTEPELNRIETWIAEHSIRIFLVIAALICVGAFFAVKAFVQSGQAAREVDVLKPQVTKIVRAAATCSAQTIKEKETSNACAARLRFALIVCRRSAQCRAALLAIVSYPPPARSTVPSGTTATTTAPDSKGGATQQPSSHGHQQPGPSGGQHQEGGQETPPTPSPGASGGEAAPEGGQGQESPGNSAEGDSSSGPDVEVCVLERTCVGIEAGL